ncbi:MAG: DEAD/DEAH box helicase [bacterium]|nr:DEAD/DEAH box helicase [bacterium]
MDRNSNSRGNSRFNQSGPRRSNNQYRGGGNRGRSGGGGGRGGRKKGKLIDPNRFVKAAKPVEQDVYVPQHKFDDFDIHPTVKDNLRSKGYETPTKIQDTAINLALEGKDVVGIANTGTGKTAAFLLPLLTKLINDRGSKALIVAPTRELAMQIKNESRDFSKGAQIFDCLLIGGVPQYPQIRDLKRNPNIVIGTPGRIKDHIDRGNLDLSNYNHIVLDEVDRMLDMGFIHDIKYILARMPAKKQAFFFSATLDQTIENLIGTFANNPVKIMARTAETSDNVEQTIVKYVNREDKVDMLHEILKVETVKKTLIFCETKHMTQKLSDKLGQSGYKAEAMHGDKSQGQRQRALRNFKDGFASILVATDVAARGIDVDGITHVINFDTPETYDDYTHRIGRTGRGNNTGYSITFVQ